jgi:hypothetical protein
VPSDELGLGKRLRVQLELATAYAMSAAIEFVKHRQNIAGVLMRVSQMFALRELCVAPGYHGRRGVIPRRDFAFWSSA